MLLFITVWGAIGVNVIISAVGSTIGPPQDRLYAVEPVGVHINIPSAVYELINFSLTIASNLTTPNVFWKLQFHLMIPEFLLFHR